MHAQHAPFVQQYLALVSQPQSLWSTYHDWTTNNPHAVRTTSLPSSMASRLSQSRIDPVFSIRAARANWKKLAPPILNLIHGHLRSLHLGSGLSTCSTCYMRDLISIQLTCKAWFSDAQRILWVALPFSLHELWLSGIGTRIFKLLVKMILRCL